MFHANIHQAKTNLSQLIQKAEAGETVIIAKAGKPCVQLTGIIKQERKAGSLKKFSHAQNTDISRILESDSDTADLFETSSL
ncbi:type II toxin-antitoxin system Phd/YefM family antitoxin [Neisseria weixii]|uniref:type II toxin-antitoxin system Phd/YefM family antitoxin n=1 Tax=Neisseria weixii TaxID=1853276 RepID=UPI000BB854CC|nr:type II toxin-antitoxin system Phd/YefM family antitoxin [Neisseria weixii]ATD64624.1 prevent-host-death protein [Neisseria weixii]